VQPSVPRNKLAAFSAARPSSVRGVTQTSIRAVSVGGCNSARAPRRSGLRLVAAGPQRGSGGCVDRRPTTSCRPRLAVLPGTHRKVPRRGGGTSLPEVDPQYPNRRRQSGTGRARRRRPRDLIRRRLSLLNGFGAFSRGTFSSLSASG